jgi:hypothetical protein
MTNGPLLIHELPSETSINAIYYRDESLKKLVKNLHKKRSSSTTNGIKLHHDNARPHMNNIIFDYLQEEKSRLWLIHHTRPTLLLQTFGYSIA